MSTQTENFCFRGREDCTPLANISSDVGNKSFICVGCNSPSSRSIPQDRFRHCWKNEAVDEISDFDKRDLLDTASVIMQALSTDENIRVNIDADEKQMQEIDFKY